jgi:hypothetical protein
MFLLQNFFLAVLDLLLDRIAKQHDVIMSWILPQAAASLLGKLAKMR